MRVQLHRVYEIHRCRKCLSSDDREEPARLVDFVRTDEAMDDRPVEIVISASIEANVEDKALHRVGLSKRHRALEECFDALVGFVLDLVVLYVEELLFRQVLKPIRLGWALKPQRGSDPRRASLVPARLRIPAMVVSMPRSAGNEPSFDSLAIL